jgi:predicted nucleic acid-binding protein
MMAELSEKLRHKFKFSENDIRAVTCSLRQVGHCFEISGALKVVDADPDDDKFIECAVVADAQLIVSGDRHLLDLRSYADIEIITAADLVARILATQ